MDKKSEKSLIPAENGFTSLVPTDEQVKESCARLHGAEGAALMGDVATIGRSARSKGMRDVARGVAILEINTLRGLHETLDRQATRLNNMKPTKAVREQLEKIVLAKVKISEAIEKHNARLLAAEGTLAGLPDDHDDPMPVNPSFKPGQAVGPGQTTIFTQSVNIASPDAKPPAPGK